MFQILVIAGLLVLAFALRTFDHPVIRKIGAGLVLAVSYLIAFFVTGSHLVGAAAVAAWFLLPWIELLTRIRRLRLPVEKALEHQAPPNALRFPHLRDFTNEVEKAGFEHVEDVGWEWDGLKQFFRIFYCPDRRMQAAVCLNEQESVAFVYVSLTSQDPADQTFRTWNYPFSYTMKVAPEVKMNRVPDAASFSELLDKHEAFLKVEGPTDQQYRELSETDLHQQLNDETRTQIEHNLKEGVIAMEGDDRFRYSWRGLFFLYGQFVKDLVKI